MNKRLAVAVLLLLPVILTCANASAAQYQATYLDLPGYTYGQAKAINGNGQVAGTTDYNLPFFWDSDGTPTSIPLPEGADEALIHGINIHGQVIGTAYGPDDFYWGRAFVWSQAGGLKLLDMPAGADGIYGKSINDTGKVLGGCQGIDEQSAIWDTSTGHVVSTTTDCYQDINNNGEIAGWWFGTNYMRAARWDTNGTLSKYEPVNGLQNSQADRINSSGQLAGLSGSAAVTLWDPDGTATELPGLGGYASIEDLNDAGQVLYLTSVSGYPLYNYLWSPGTGVTEFAGIVAGLNNSGQVVGSLDGRPCIWTAVPEPSSVMALATGLAGILGLRLRRRG